MFVDVFIRRPILAGVLAAVIVLAGAISIPVLPIAQFPQLAAPQVIVSTVYTGANAAVVETAVTQPLEQAINGVQGMTYMTSTSGNDGSCSITVTFEVNRDPDLAAVDVQNRVNIALRPAAVRGEGRRRHRQQVVERVRLRRGHLLGPRAVRPAVHEQLRRRLHPRRAEAGARRRRRPDLRRAEVLDAPLAGRRPAGQPAARRPTTWSTRCATRTSRWRPARSASRRRAPARPTRSASAPRAG